MAPRTMIVPPPEGDEATVTRPAPTENPRLPRVGSAIVRQYKGRMLRVIVREDGFELDGERYATLSAVAKRVTGSHVNGFRFFRLEARR